MIYRQTKSNYQTYLPIPKEEGITVIGAGACYRKRAYRIEIPEGVEIIEPYAFAGCDELAELTLPSTLKVIGEGAFLDCHQLRAITVPENVDTIGALAFWNAGRYRRKSIEITVPDSVRTVGESIFALYPPRGERIVRPKFTAVIEYKQNGKSDTVTLTELDPYLQQRAVSFLPDRPFVLLSVDTDSVTIYSTNDEVSLVLPLSKTVSSDTTHIVGAAYEYTDMTTTYRYSSEFTLKKLSFQ